MFSLPSVTQLHPPSARSQTSYQEFSGCLAGSGSWSKLMAEQQSSPQCETYPPIYPADCRHDVVAAECAATYSTYVSTFFFSTFPPFCPALSLFSFFISSPVCRSPTMFLPFLFSVAHPFISLSLTPSSSHSPQYKRKHTQFTNGCRIWIKKAAEFRPQI